MMTICLQNGSDYPMKARCAKHYFISELLEAAPAVFISLSIGILWVIVSLITGSEIPASGGVLVGAALVAEVLLQKSAWLYAANIAGLNSVIYRNTGFRSEDGTPLMAFHIVTHE